MAMPRVLPLVLLLASAALAGCGSAPADRRASVGADPASTSTPSPLVLAANGTLPRLELTGCTGFEAAQPFLGGSAPGQSPSGWEPQSPTSSATLFGFDCHRIHLGPLERGPIRIVLDGHDHASKPAACVANATGQPHEAIVHLLLTNDTGLAALLRDQFGLPTAAADIDAAVQDTGALRQVAWSWGIAGQEASTLTGTADTTSEPYLFSTRLFWQRGDGLGVLDLSFPQRDGPTAYTAREAHGTMRPPMLMASQPQGQFAGTLTYFPAMSGEGAFRLYADTLCRSLESSS
jgi:hypothetical protein